MKKVENLTEKSKNLADSFGKICHGKEIDVVVAGLSMFLLEFYLNQVREDVSIEEFTDSLKESMTSIYLTRLE